jgi:Flp pilus assembly protein TadG
MLGKFKGEAGAVYPLALFLIPVFLLMAGLIVDTGMGIYQHTKLTSAVDAAAIGSLDAYDRDEWEENKNIVIDHADALRLATMYLTTNMPDATIESIQVDGDRVTVKARATAQVFFMSMFGKDDFTLEASARASLDNNG